MKLFFDEVNAVDKYEYKLKTEQMLELMEDGAYRKAADLADTIDWKRVRNAAMLTNVSDIYEKNKEYQKSYEVLNLAYRRAEGSRKIISRLCTLALKTGNVDEAIDYYDDFMQVAPKDPNQYILRYQILRAQRAPIEQQIEALEEYKKSEYIEEWAYELAKLYQEAGMTAECLEECDDLILWFSEGQYVYKAMELKMQYKPLTPSQQEKYDRRYEKLSAETEEMPDIVTYAEEKAGAVDAGGSAGPADTSSEERSVDDSADDKTESDTNSESPAETANPSDVRPDVRDGGTDTQTESDEQADTAVKEEKTVQKKKLGDTMPLDEALRRLLHPGKKEPEKETENVAEEEPELGDLEKAISEIESVADMEMVTKIADEKKRPASSSGGMKEIIPDEDDEISGQMNLEDILTGWEGEPADDAERETAGDESTFGAVEEIIARTDVPDFGDSKEELDLADTEGLTGEIDLTEAEDLTGEIDLTEAEDLTGEIDLTEAEDLTGEIDLTEAEDLTGEIDLTEAEDLTGEKDLAEEKTLAEKESDITTEGDTTGETMETKKKTEPILPPDIQRMIDEIEGVIPPEEEVKPRPERTLKRIKEEPHENMGKVTEELRMSLDDDDEYSDDDEYLDDGEEYVEEDEYLDDGEEYVEEDEYPDDGEEYAEEDEYPDDGEEYAEEDEYLDDGEEYAEEDEYPDDGEEYAEEDEYLDDGEEYADEDEYPDDDEELEADDYDEYEDEFEEEPDSAEEYDEYSGYDDEAPDLEEEFRVNPDHSDEPDDREIPDDDDDGMDILSATTPLSRKETAKLIATGKTAPLPLNEISDALSMSDTGFIVHGRYDLELQSGIGTRAGLTEEQKKLFSYFVPVRGMSEQLVDVLEQDKNCTNRQGTSKTGNLLIIGNKGNGKTVLAVDVVKAIQKQREIKQGKVAIVTGESLNKKKISDIFDKLYGGALIIEKAGKMNERTVARLNKAMEKDTGELLIVLEEQRKPLDRLLSSNREFRRKFTCRLEVPIFINDELVTFGQTYAQENGYRIDEMGILALYSKIDSLQREDHAVTVAEVKEIMDDAIQHSQKASAKKLMKRVFGKNTDEADRILLSEKDFNV